MPLMNRKGMRREGIPEVICSVKKVLGVVISGRTEKVGYKNGKRREDKWVRNP